jgi:hypothetical protein
MLSTASLSALSYEHTLSQFAIRLWDDTRHVTTKIMKAGMLSKEIPT